MFGHGGAHGEGEGYIYVLSGSIEMHTEFYEPVRLDVGDSAYIDSGMRHAFASLGPEDARILSVCLADSPLLFAATPMEFSEAK